MPYTPYLLISPVKFDDEKYTPNILLIIGTIGLLVNLIINIGSRFKSIRDNVRFLKTDLKDLENKLFEPLKFKINLIICLLLSIGVFCVSLMIDSRNIMNFINLMTCLFTPYYAIYLPVLMNLKMRKELGLKLKNQIFMIVMGIFFGVLMIVSWGYSLASYLSNENMKK